jgi:hypothetical protein
MNADTESAPPLEGESGVVAPMSPAAGALAAGAPALAARAVRRDPEAWARQQRLLLLHGPLQLQGALLALVMTRGSPREREAWRAEMQALAQSDQLLEDVEQIDPAARLPWFELLSQRLAHTPVQQRQRLAESVRRVMRADGRVDALDWLMWLALRRQLGERPRQVPPSGGENDIAQLQPAQAEAVAHFSAFLSRIVPHREPDLVLDDEAPGERWYAMVTSHWDGLPPRHRVDADTLARALRTLQGLAWMLRPVLVRIWYDAASQALAGHPLPPEAADALRLVCLLLDSPMPAGLAAQFVEPPRR